VLRHNYDIAFSRKFGIFLAVGILLANFTFIEAFFLSDRETTTKKPPSRCYGTEYNSCKQICCGNQVYERSRGDEGCCGWKLINTDREICCDNSYIIMKEEECSKPVSS
ncbi:hypothetical protein LSAT2_009077, partial [Lamellibrachia satsuma]